MDHEASMLSFFAMSSEDFASVNIPASVFSILMNIFFIYCMVFQQPSSCATVIYLWKHLKNMKESNTLSSPRFQRQIRMTIRRFFKQSGGISLLLQAVVCPDYF
ncbi:uncharacterized protein LOC117597436 [Pangasianodon hypophthalmus]|uniref:uncharacterized protein LOC117597436 n=1 Tax=Pangasianodon hypophthalmus TaxID=310915 RepID=UPI002307246F|nr:uncharacterized protein LOC117597436 [Pangasianodon hypophthalmus]